MVVERDTAGGKVHVEFQFHISCLVSRSAACLSVYLSTVQETDKIGVDGNGYSSSSFSYNNVSWVSRSVSLQGLVGILLPREREKKSKIPMKTPWQEEEGEEEEDKAHIIDDDVNDDDDDEATASETLLSKPARRETTTTTNNTNIPFPHHPPYSSKQQRHHHHHHQTRLLLLLTSILILCPSIFLLGFALGSSRQTTLTTPTQSTSITNDDINDNKNTNQPYFSHPSKPSPIPLHPPPLPLEEEKEKEETPPFPPNPSLHQKTFNGSFFHETKFRAKASPDVDRVWESLGINCSFYSISLSPSL